MYDLRDLTEIESVNAIIDVQTNYIVIALRVSK